MKSKNKVGTKTDISFWEKTENDMYADKEFKSDDEEEELKEDNIHEIKPKSIRMKGNIRKGIIEVYCSKLKEKREK